MLDKYRSLRSDMIIHDVPKLIIKIVQEHDEGDQIRNHPKKRINKKWLKRYGCYGTQKLKRGEIVFDGNTVYMSRPTFNKLAHDNGWKVTR